eukprot:m.74961 g.74961  ORF g.74961 m.74961 type:complete len:518 (-) comp14461_c0_seq5:168-1721(-)
MPKRKAAQAAVSAAASASSASASSAAEGTSITGAELLKRGRTGGRSPPESDSIDKHRVRAINGADWTGKGAGCVIYWMSRDQRAKDNWALLYARHLSHLAGTPLRVVFNLVPQFLEATERQFRFMIRGLKETESELRKKQIPFHLLMGDPCETVPKFALEHKAAAVVCDQSPLRVPIQWASSVAAALDDKDVPCYQVDAHNVVPVWAAYPKQAYSARVIRPSIEGLMSKFLKPYPELEPNHDEAEMPKQVDWKAADKSLTIDRSVKEVGWLKPGTAAAERMFEEFCSQRLGKFAASRNNPNVAALSNMSPYLHFGQISAATLVMTLKKEYGKKHSESVKSFVEEAVVRRELADNFCFFNPNYDTLDCAFEWARLSLEKHKDDPREYVYTFEEFEQAKTHDDLWNAAQLQMVTEGKMHGFLRMYWAKKILEWTPDPATALKYSIRLNDKYELDGRDPNGYTGCAWSIAGIHDQGWAERAVFGKIRFMNYNGCKRKFNVDEFVAKYPPAKDNAKAASKK